MEIETLVIAIAVIVSLIENCILRTKINKLVEEVEDMDKSFNETIIDLQNSLSKVEVDKKNKYEHVIGMIKFNGNGHRISIQQFVDIILDHLKIDIKKAEGLSIYKTKK